MVCRKIVAFLLVLVCIAAFLPAAQAAELPSGNVSVAAGKYHSLAALKDGSLYVWGDNTKGQIGNGTKAQQNTPLKIMDDVYAVAAGDTTSYALTYSGDLYAWGDNAQGQCGVQGSDAYDKPVRVLQDIVSVSATKTHAYAVSSSGDLFFWGESVYRGMDWGEVTYTYLQPNGSAVSATPQKLVGGVSEVTCYGSATAIFKTDGSLWCWSRYLNGAYKLVETRIQYTDAGTSTRLSTWQLVPVKISDAARAAAPNGSTGVYLDENGVPKYWIGSSPVYVPQSLEGKITDIGTNGTTSFYISDSGGLYADGSDTYSLTGLGATVKTASFAYITNNVEKVCVGLYHAVMIKQSGEIWTWGTNEYGQLGNGTGVNYNVPFRIMEGDGTGESGGQDQPVTVVFDGKRMLYDVDPVIRNNRTLVPFRAIFEALGADVSWDGTTQTATAVKSDITLKITVGNTTAYINGAPFVLDAAPELVSGRNMVPLRFISEAMNCEVTYIASERLVDIRSENAFVMLSDNVKNTMIGYTVYIETGENSDRSIYYTATGVVIDPSGIILTNKHVTEGMDWIKTTVGSTTYRNFQLLYEDPELDYAIYKIKGASLNLAVPVLGDSTKLKTGSELFTCGNPLGVRNICSRGTIAYDFGTDFDATVYSQHGSSGSGVYNSKLELVGVIRAFDALGKTLIVPMALMQNTIDTIIAQYGSAAKSAA